jgi:signal transduction histidine kinase
MKRWRPDQTQWVIILPLGVLFLLLGLLAWTALYFSEGMGGHLHNQRAVLGLMMVLLGLGFTLTVLSALDINRLIEDLKQSRKLSEAIQEVERSRIAQELHDGVIQSLVALKREQSEQAVDRLVEDVRRICQNLKPHMLETLGLGDTLIALSESFQDRNGIRVHCHLDDLSRLPASFQLPLFRVIQELLNNVEKHAKATRVTLSMHVEAKECRLLVTDNGKGFDLKACQPGLGLKGMTERVHSLGGHIRQDANPGKGVVTMIRIPLPHASEN